MKVGDIVTLVGLTLHAKWRGQNARIVEVRNHMLTVVIIECNTTLLVFAPEVRIAEEAAS